MIDLYMKMIPQSHCGPRGIPIKAGASKASWSLVAFKIRLDNRINILHGSLSPSNPRSRRLHSQQGIHNSNLVRRDNRDIRSSNLGR